MPGSWHWDRRLTIRIFFFFFLDGERREWLEKPSNLALIGRSNWYTKARGLFIILQSEVEVISASEPGIGKEHDTMTGPEQFSGIAELQVCSYRSIHVLL